jgi:hypothetical protein
MQEQYDWIKDQIAQGKTVLAYDRRIAGGKVKRLKSMDRVMMWVGTLWIDEMNATGWTFAVKPEKPQ